MDGEPRTIVLLGAKRSGSTAVFRMFQRHPDASVCHTDQSIHNWEPNFWNFAAAAIAGDSTPFADYVPRACPFLEGRVPRTPGEAHAMWDEVLAALGPVVFDKSPRYLTSDAALDLLLGYRDLGRDVRLLAIVRDPRDVIASQFELWGHLVEDDSPEKRERQWVAMHRRLIEFQRRAEVLQVRYEDLAADPAGVGGRMLAHCGLAPHEACTAHLKPTNVGRHRTTGHERLRSWRPGPKLLALMDRYGYGGEGAGEEADPCVQSTKT